MMEAIGLSGITETPLVIVNTQRGGPSTGLPTKQEQSDLMAMVYGTHGEIPKVVIAPSTVEEAFYDTVEAFNIAEEYQCPVIVLTDLALSLGKQTVEQLNYERIDIRRGKLLKESELPQLEGVEYFNRFAVTEDGISPRVLPGFKNGLHHVTGVEHNEQGKPSENPINRQKQMDKRLNKLNTLIKRFEQPIYFYAPHEKADLLLVGFNSTKGTIEETIERFEKDGTKVHHIQMRLIHPFPKEEFERLTKRANKIVVVENNATAQLANIIKANVTKLELESVLKYNGNPFLPSEIYEQCKELL